MERPGSLDVTSSGFSRAWNSSGNLIQQQVLTSKPCSPPLHSQPHPGISVLTPTASWLPQSAPFPNELGEIGPWNVLEVWVLGRKTPHGPSRPVLFLLCASAGCDPVLSRLFLEESPSIQSREQQLLSPLGGSPTVVPPEGPFPALGDEGLEEILGPPEISVEESAGGTLHCASFLPHPRRDLGLPEVGRQVRSCPHLPLSPAGWSEPANPSAASCSPCPMAPAGRGGCDIPVPGDLVPGHSRTTHG